MSVAEAKEKASSDAASGGASPADALFDEIDADASGTLSYHSLNMVCLV